MCEYGKEVVLNLPENIDTCKEIRTVSIDDCIVPVIKHLWENNINTLGCCCMHGKGNPCMVISSDYKNAEIQDVIIPLIAQIDSRKWDIYQWRLTRVNSETPDALRKLATHCGQGVTGKLLHKAAAEIEGKQG